MAELEYGGLKASGSKLLLVIPLAVTIVGGLWGGFEVYQRYLDMEARISSFVTPDLSDFDKRLAVMGEQFVIVEAYMAFASKEINLFKGEIDDIKDVNDEQYQTLKNLKKSVRDDITRQGKIIDDVEDEIAQIEDDVRETLDIADVRFENKRDQLQNDYEQKSDTIRVDVERKLTDLETRLNKKLQRALDNPLAN